MVIRMSSLFIAVAVLLAACGKDKDGKQALPPGLVTRQTLSINQSANGTKKNPALVGPGSWLRTARRENYMAVVLVHEIRLGVTVVCAVGVETTVVEGNQGGANPCEKRWSK